jgi:hypothetical protein
MPEKKRFRAIWKHNGEVFEAWPQANGFSFERPGSSAKPSRHLPAEDFWRHFQRADDTPESELKDDLLLFGGTRG